jgi:hypothetical protein
MQRSGIADLPLHGGPVPRRLADGMVFDDERPVAKQRSLFEA